MGPCIYCGKMIYLDWIAERGYHRECHERYLRERPALLPFEIQMRADREHEKRRQRKANKRKAKKALRRAAA